jgi:hypothetical protein
MTFLDLEPSAVWLCIGIVVLAIIGAVMVFRR